MPDDWVDVGAMSVVDTLLYILDDQHAAVPADDTLTWGRWMQEHKRERKVAEHISADGWWISTIFTGVEMRIFVCEGGPSTPLLFETMAFSPDRHIVEQYRCATWAQAQVQHAAVVALVAARGITLMEV